MKNRTGLPEQPVERRTGGAVRSAAVSLFLVAAIILAARARQTAETNSAPALTPNEKQVERKLPRFEARQHERDAMAKLLREVYGLRDESILKAMRRVPRHEFVPAKLSTRAYHDTPLPIGYGQTISQPYIVAEMTRQLHLTQSSKVLEIGTGSGYQAAVLNECTTDVYTIEIVKPLAEAAAKHLYDLGYHGVRCRHADGYYGWPDEAPFDAIIVTCAAGQIPPPLVAQLAPGGRMVIPVGLPFAVQDLMLVRKTEEGAVISRSLMSVRFVPLVRSEE